jgi:hypothetical protein
MFWLNSRMSFLRFSLRVRVSFGKPQRLFQILPPVDLNTTCSALEKNIVFPKVQQLLFRTGFSEFCALQAAAAAATAATWVLLLFVGVCSNG